MATSIRRSVQIKVTLSADLHAQLGQLAAQLGQAPATVASMAIGQFVRTQMLQAAHVQRAMEGMVESVGMVLREEVEQMKLLEQPSSKPAAKKARKV